MIVDALLALAVVLAWLGAIGLWRLPTPLERLHAVTFVNAAAGGALLCAAFATDGVSPRALKCLAIWVAVLLGGALTSYRTARAVHLRGGERR